MDEKNSKFFFKYYKFIQFLNHLNIIIKGKNGKISFINEIFK